MNIYEIIYSIQVGGNIDVEANSEDEAEVIFGNMELEDLCEIKDILRGIEIMEINKI